MDNLLGLRAFVRVVELGNFSEAGRQLGMAPSSVSRQISQLEDDLAVQLFNRTTRKVSLTEAGKLYHQRVSRIITDLDDSNRLVSNLDHTPTGMLHINAPTGFGTMHIVPAVIDFLKEFPEVDIDLQLTDSIVDVVESGVDMVIRVGALKESSLIARKLAENHRVLCASPAYIRTNGKPKDLHDLQNHSCLAYSFPGRANEWHAAEKLEEGKFGTPQIVIIKGRMMVNNTSAIYDACLHDLGLSVLPTWVVGEDIKAGRLVELMPELEFSPTQIETAIYALYPPTRHMSARVRSFLDFLRKRIGRVPYWERETSFMYV